MIKSTRLAVDWSEAIDKKESEGVCRVCRRPEGITVDGDIVRLECAHLAGIEHDPIEEGPRGGLKRVVPRESTIPLCGDCHIQQHQHRLDLIPFTTCPEQAFVVKRFGLVRTLERLGGG